MKFPLVYEINTRCWLRELSERAGARVRLDEVPDGEFQSWQDRGFTHLWLMGVWEVGPRSRAEAVGNPALRAECRRVLPDFKPQDVTGSPYAVAGYHVSGDFGGEAGLARFRRRLHRHGMKLILDFIPNHVGLDHPWVTAHPEWFVQTASRRPGTFRPRVAAGAPWLAHGRDPNFPPWTDTVQLDYRHPALRSAMVEELRAVAERCDGVRCDMAMLVLSEVFERVWNAFPVGHPRTGPGFWSEAIPVIKAAHPSFLFLGEVYWDLEERLQEAGFDFCYDKRLYDLLAGSVPAAAGRYVRSKTSDFLQRSAHFLENHDEARAASLLDPARHRAAALVVLGLPGLRLVHQGQLTGAQQRVPVQLARLPAEEPQPAVAAMYNRLLGALLGTAVGRGEAQVLVPRPAWPENPAWENFILVQWQDRKPAYDLVVVNLSPLRAQCFAPVVAEGQARHEWLFEDRLGDERHLRSGADLEARGLYLDVPGNAVQLFHCRPA